MEKYNMIHAITQLSQESTSYIGGGSDPLSEKKKKTWRVYEDLMIKMANAIRGPVITLDDVPESLPYVTGMKMDRPGRIKKNKRGDIIIEDNHNGQLKLFLAEVQFLLLCMKAYPKVRVFVYAGAAPNNKGALLAKLFPDWIFIFVDPAPFDVRDTEKYKIVLRKWYDHTTAGKPLDHDAVLNGIKKASCNINIIQDYMTPELSSKIRSVFGDVAFMSDIRTNVQVGDVREMRNTEITPDAVDIIWNSAQMISWMHEMRPVMSSIKWRFPFYEEDDKFVLQQLAELFRKRDIDRALELGFDLMSDYKNRTMHFYPGVNYLQAFPGGSSTEGRLVVDGKDLDKVHDYGDAQTQDSKFFYYNNIERVFVQHTHSFTSRELGVDKCNDCAIMVTIFQDYINQYNPIGDFIPWILEEIKKTTGRSLFIGGHGHFFEPYTAEDLFKIRQMRNAVRATPKHKFRR
jgi:hypothetical protein